MSRPIFTSDTAVAFAEHLLTVADALARVLRSGDVPEPAMISVAEHQVTVTPWEPGAPVTALLAWAAHLTDPEFEAQVHELATPDRTLVSVYARGQLDGHGTELIGSTWRELPDVDLTVTGKRQPVDLDHLRELADREQPIGDLS